MSQVAATRRHRLLTFNVSDSWHSMSHTCLSISSRLCTRRIAIFSPPSHLFNLMSGCRASSLKPKHRNVTSRNISSTAACQAGGENFQGRTEVTIARYGKTFIVVVGDNQRGAEIWISSRPVGRAHSVGYVTEYAVGEGWVAGVPFYHSRKP